ncbi:MAG: ATP-binding cassette subfamily B protein [Verrucomicrobiales bacterium]|jgi:ATP-binding cassette subfamily B protein
MIGKMTDNDRTSSDGDGDDGDVDKRFRAELPEKFQSEFPVAVDCLVCMQSDLNQAGHFSVSWLAITNDHVLVFEEESAPVVLALQDIDEVEVDELFSAGRLVARMKNKSAVALISYSRNLVPEFAAAARMIDDLSHQRPLIYPELEGAAVSDSGIPLPRRGGHSPMDVPRWKILGRLTHFLVPYKGKVIILMTLIFISVLAQMATPLLTKYIVDGILRDAGANQAGLLEAGRELDFYVLLIAISFVVILFTRLWANSLKVWISGRLTADLRGHLHRKMQRLSMDYHNKRESGELVGRVMGDTAELQHFLVDGVPFLFVNVLSFIGIGAILVWLHPFLALCVFLPVPFLLGGGTWFWKRLIPLFHKRGNRNSVLHSSLGESIRGVKAIKALGQEGRRHRSFSSTNENLFKVSFRVDRTFIRFFEVMALFMGFGTVAVWYFGGHSILTPDSNFSFGDLIAFIGYMAMFYGPLQWFTAVVNWMTHAFASTERILQVLDQKSESYDVPGAVAMPTVQGAVAFEDVRFSYSRGKEVIRGVSFSIEAGQMIGLVGKSGAGKSTIINLICRFYDPDSGRILIDGNDLKDIKLSDWRKHIGIVMQDPFLFSANIADNIAYGAPDASFEDVVRAARAAKAHDFILEKEEGYDTVLGEGGVELSGGERQRIAIARAILNDPPVLILDEATSAVDSETEKAIQEAISTLVKGRTTIAIAHRLATLRNADRLVVIENGKVLEQGTHEELLAKKDGHFANLVNLQAENNRLRGEAAAYSTD